MGLCLGILSAGLKNFQNTIFFFEVTTRIYEVCLARSNGIDRKEKRNDYFVWLDLAE